VRSSGKRIDGMFDGPSDHEDKDVKAVNGRFGSSTRRSATMPAHGISAELLKQWTPIS